MDKLSTAELKALEVLTFFFYETGSSAAALRAVQCLLSVDPGNLWARGLMVLCENTLEHYSKVVDLTDDLSDFAADAARWRALTLLRARALNKLGRTAEAQAVLRQLPELKGAL